jgi:hypothetical protein
MSNNTRLLLLQNGWTALHYAAWQNYVLVVDQLLHAGAAVNAATKVGTAVQINCSILVVEAQCQCDCLSQFFELISMCSALWQQSGGGMSIMHANIACRMQHPGF